MRKAVSIISLIMIIIAGLPCFSFANDSDVVTEGIDLDSRIEYNASFPDAPAVTLNSSDYVRVDNYYNSVISDQYFDGTCTRFQIYDFDDLEFVIDYGVVGRLNNRNVVWKLTLSEFTYSQSYRAFGDGSSTSDPELGSGMPQWRLISNLDSASYDNCVSIVGQETEAEGENLTHITRNDPVIEIFVPNDPARGLVTFNAYKYRAKYEICYENGEKIDSAKIVFGSLNGSTVKNKAANNYTFDTYSIGNGYATGNLAQCERGGSNFLRYAVYFSQVINNHPQAEGVKPLNHGKISIEEGSCLGEQYDLIIPPKITYKIEDSNYQFQGLGQAVEKRIWTAVIDEFEFINPDIEQDTGYFYSDYRKAWPNESGGYSAPADLDTYGTDNYKKCCLGVEYPDSRCMEAYITTMRNNIWMTNFFIGKERCYVKSRYVDEEGSELADYESYWGVLDDPYETEEKTIKGWELKEVQGNETGLFTIEDQEVVYVYKRILHDLTIRKDTINNTEGTFSFKIKAWDGEDNYLDFSSRFGNADEEGYYSFNLSNNDAVTIPGIPDGSEYEVLEESQDGWDLIDKENDSGVLESDTTASFLNEKKNTLTLRKTVEGSMGDKNKEFDFVVKIYNESTSDPLDLSSYGGAENEDGSYTFKLKHGDELEITEISERYKYEVSESDYSTEGYVTTVGGETSRAVEGIMSADQTLSFVNRKDAVAATGVKKSRNVPIFLFMLLSAILLLILKRIRSANR